MAQNQVLRTTNRVWDFLEPAMVPAEARTKHIKLKASSGAGTYLTYPYGQIVAQKDDGSNEYAKVGTSGYTGPKLVLKYSFTVDSNGNHQFGLSWNVTGYVRTGSIEAFYWGFFRCEDLIGLATEIQTETVTATGGTRKLTFKGQTTASLAFDANAAALQAGLEALSNIDPGDVTVTGTGPFVYTFGGQYAKVNVPLMKIDTSLLTGGSSTIAESAGSDIIVKVGRLVQGTAEKGILQLGTATLTA